MLLPSPSLSSASEACIAHFQVACLNLYHIPVPSFTPPLSCSTDRYLFDIHSRFSPVFCTTVGAGGGCGGSPSRDACGAYPPRPTRRHTRVQGRRLVSRQAQPYRWQGRGEGEQRSEHSQHVFLQTKGWMEVPIGEWGPSRSRLALSIIWLPPIGSLGFLLSTSCVCPDCVPVVMVVAAVGVPPCPGPTD